MKSQENVKHKIKELEQEKILLAELNLYLDEKRDIEINEFLQVVSHELKTPLVPIMTNLDLILRHDSINLNEKQRKYLSEIRTNVAFLSQIIKNLLDAKKFAFGEIILSKQQADLNEIIRNVIHMMRQSYSNVPTITYDVQQKIPTICDVSRITQVIFNLLKNSVESTTVDGLIVVNVLNDEDIVTISVSDDGVGISQDRMNDLFKMFYQSDMSTTREKNGLGLGLYLCKKIIEAHGGTIWAKSGLGVGTTITFVLPKGIIP